MRMQPTNIDVEVAAGVRLRVRAWRAKGAPVSVPYLLVHGLSSNARLWDGVAVRLHDAHLGVECGRLTFARLVLDERARDRCHLPGGLVEPAVKDNRARSARSNCGTFIRGCSWKGLRQRGTAAARQTHRY